jgi:hypothetical protein
MTENRGGFDDRNDDVDLSIVVRKMVRFFTINGKLLIIASLTGLFCGIIIHVSFPKQYEAKLLMESTVLSNLEQSELIEDLGHLARRHNDLLQQQFNCPPAIAQNIMGLSIDQLSTTPDGVSSFIVTVNIKDTSLLHGVQDALLNGLRNNDFVKQKVAIRMASLEKEIEQAEGEITKLDSPKVFIESLVHAEKKDNGPLIVNVADISRQKVEIAERLAGYKERLAFGKGVSLVLGYSTVYGPKPGLLTLLAAGLIAGFIIGYLVAVFRSLTRMAKQKN